MVQLHAEAGDSVKAGQLLLSLDDTDAQLSYQMAQTSYERTAVSVDTTLGSSYESKINSAKSQLDNAQQAPISTLSARYSFSASESWLFRSLISSRSALFALASASLALSDETAECQHPRQI